jgi:hypothetical protein
MAAVDVEVGIGREKDRVGVNLGHAHQTCLSEAHGHIGVFPHQRQDWLKVVPAADRPILALTGSLLSIQHR